MKKKQPPETSAFCVQMCTSCPAKESMEQAQGVKGLSRLLYLHRSPLQLIENTSRWWKGKMKARSEMAVRDLVCSERNVRSRRRKPCPLCPRQNKRGCLLSYYSARQVFPEAVQNHTARLAMCSVPVRISGIFRHHQNKIEQLIKSRFSELRGKQHTCWATVSAAWPQLFFWLHQSVN